LLGPYNDKSVTLEDSDNEVDFAIEADPKLQKLIGNMPNVVR